MDPLTNPCQHKYMFILVNVIMKQVKHFRSFTVLTYTLAPLGIFLLPFDYLANTLPKFLRIKTFFFASVSANCKAAPKWHKNPFTNLLVKLLQELTLWGQGQSVSWNFFK